MPEAVLQFMQVVGGIALIGLVLWPFVMVIRKVTRWVSDRKAEWVRLKLQVDRLTSWDEHRGKEITRLTRAIEAKDVRVDSLERRVKKLEQRWEQPEGELK